MNVTVAEQDKLKRKLSVEVPLSEVQAVYEDVYRQLSSGVRVKGFRPGKFPRHLAEKRFQSVMAGEAMQTLVPKYFQAAVEELKMRPATEPQFDNLDIDKAKPFKFDVAFEVVPEFELAKPADFALTEKKTQVTAKDVAARIDELRKQRGAFEDKGQQTAAKGDLVTFDFQGTMDGTPFDGGSGENQSIEVGAGQYLPEFDAAFEGIKAGETKTFDLTFPEDYGAADIAGKAVQFTVTAHKVEQKAPAPLDETFFGQFGEEVKSEKDLNDHIQKQLEEEQAREAMQTHRNLLADQMREVYDFEVPEALVAQGLHELEHQLEREDPETLADEKKLAKRKAEERGKIEANLRLAYAIDALAKQYEVEANQDDVRQRFFLQAYMMQQNPQELMQSPFGRRMLMSIEQDLITGTTLERLAYDVLATGGKGSGRKAAPKAGKAAKAETGGSKAAGKEAGKKTPAKAGPAGKSAAKPAAKPAAKAAAKPDPKAKKPAAKASAAKAPKAPKAGGSKD